MNSMFVKLIELTRIGLKQASGLSFGSREAKTNDRLSFNLYPCDTFKQEHGRLCEICITCDLPANAIELKYLWWAESWSSKVTKVRLHSIDPACIDVAQSYRLDLMAMHITHTILVDLHLQGETL